MGRGQLIAAYFQFDRTVFASGSWILYGHISPIGYLSQIETCPIVFAFFHLEFYRRSIFWWPLSNLIVRFGRYFVGYFFIAKIQWKISFSNIFRSHILLGWHHRIFLSCHKRTPMWWSQALACSLAVRRDKLVCNVSPNNLALWPWSNVVYCSINREVSHAYLAHSIQRPIRVSYLQPAINNFRAGAQRLLSSILGVTHFRACSFNFWLSLHVLKAIKCNQNSSAFLFAVKLRRIAFSRFSNRSVSFFGT